ncbi:M48 family metalloprotease [Magnetofaba australis]|uniref:Putative peptidase M48 Ste24p n=1 Tax=Magnetofaba australis IT-1 TaxID=1434232 RepID=A0A1Y2K2H5_9PROT|nr:M48 family metalloprotease [Magnetofaba australis]OSM02159.1 putative peptidase M48 Ste24p [Magnetofaba australis IT-1]
MNRDFADRLWNRRFNRRDFVWLSTLSSVGLAACGNSVNPVTGEEQFLLMSESQEINIDKEQAPHQFSEDYGPVSDARVNGYLTRVGQELAQRSHRPQMPYSFRALEANRVNAYTFPGGSVAATRGILAEMQDESQLAGLLGHELGHVNARHAAQRQTKTIFAQALLAGVGMVANAKAPNQAGWINQLGGLGAGALLSSYSRDNEREADSLGMTYMSRTGYDPEGMVGLMQMLNSQSEHKPNALELMMATHPLSSERIANAQAAIAEKRGEVRPGGAVNRERYMDNTASIRALKPVIDELQKGEDAFSGKQYAQADRHIRSAIKQAPQDYPALVLMAKTQLALNHPNDALRYAEDAKRIKPSEAQAQHMTGVAQLALHRPDAALASFRAYEQRLPGNPDTLFLQGIAMEQMRDVRGAATAYNSYLRQVRQGAQAKYAATRLQAWRGR